MSAMYSPHKMATTHLPVSLLAEFIQRILCPPQYIYTLIFGHAYLSWVPTSMAILWGTLDSDDTDGQPPSRFRTR